MLTVLRPVLVYDRSMQLHLYANLPHCVTNLRSNLLSGISIFQILYLILASFKGAFVLSPTFRIYHVPKLQRKIRRHHFSTDLTYANLWHFATSGHETFYFVKANPENPDFLFHILLIYKSWNLSKYTFWLGITHTKVSILPLKLLIF